MEKCNCWCEQFCADGKSKYHYCIGTKEWDQCSCGGDRSKCDFYEHVREKAILEAAQQYNDKATIYFQWKSMDEVPMGREGKHPDILVCYLDRGVPRYKPFKFLDKFNMESSYIAKHAVAWCYIEQPKNLMTKEEAIKNLKNAGIFDEAGNLVPIYESILVKVDDL
jgi:hypothetical protein